jgi:hypothetical protein
MEISVHLRGGDNVTDMRTVALAKGISYLPHTVRVRSRGESAAGADLVVQTGFARSAALVDAIERGIPYLIMEAPCFRDIYDVELASNFTYNGFQGGGTRPKAGKEPRKAPELQELRTEGSTLIMAQKPTDHSLRGSDHIAWLQEKLNEYPEAELRHHPIMVPPGHNEPIAVALSKCKRAITYTSTTAIDSGIAGCQTICEHPASEGWRGGDREEWLHRLSWSTFTHSELGTDDVAAYILTGYEEAKANASEGLQEIPREKEDGAAICRRYYRAFE